MPRTCLDKRSVLPYSVAMRPPSVHAPASIRPTDEDFDRNVREAMKDSANAISVAWLASECRRARYQEQHLREAVERVKRQLR